MPFYFDDYVEGATQKVKLVEDKIDRTLSLFHLFK